MPRSDLVSLIIRLAIGLVILALIGWLLFTRLRKPRVTTQPTPNPSDTPVVIITDDPAPTIIPSPSLPDIGTVPSGTVTGNATDQAPAYRQGTSRTIQYSRGYTTYTTTYYNTGMTTTATNGGASASATGASASASASAGSASASASAGSASASASARSW